MSHWVPGQEIVPHLSWETDEGGNYAGVPKVNFSTQLIENKPTASPVMLVRGR